LQDIGTFYSPRKISIFDNNSIWTGFYIKSKVKKSISFQD